MLTRVVIEKEASALSQVDLLTTSTDENSGNLFVTNILQKVLAVKYKLCGLRPTMLPYRVNLLIEIFIKFIILISSESYEHNFM